MANTPFGSHNPSDIVVWLDVPRTISEYTETQFNVVDGIRVAKASGPVTRRDSGSAEFAGRLTAIVQNMFNETVATAKSARKISVIPISGLRSFFDNGEGGQFVLRPGLITDTDLLCYVRMSRQESFFRSLDRTRWLAIASNATGFTYPAVAGVLSEAWFGDSGRDIYGVANTIYHELMHNKTNYVLGEDGNWVHGPAGGGGLAAPNNAGALARFTDLNKLALAKRFAIKQYTVGLH